MIGIAVNFLLLLIGKVEYNVWQRKHGQDVAHGKQIAIVAAEAGLVTFLTLGFTWHSVAVGLVEMAL